MVLLRFISSFVPIPRRRKTRPRPIQSIVDRVVFPPSNPTHRWPQLTARRRASHYLRRILWLPELISSSTEVVRSLRPVDHCALSVLPFIPSSVRWLGDLLQPLNRVCIQAESGNNEVFFNRLLRLREKATCVDLIKGRRVEWDLFTERGTKGAFRPTSKHVNNKMDIRLRIVSVLEYPGRPNRVP